MSLLLDTCSILWLASEPQRLTARTLARLADPLETVHVSAISAGEIACLSERGRLVLPAHWRRWFRIAVEQNGWAIEPIGLDVIEEAYSLPGTFHPDPADRILVATARLRGLTIVTGDEKILAYPHVTSIN